MSRVCMAESSSSDVRNTKMSPVALQHPGTLRPGTVLLMSFEVVRRDRNSSTDSDRRPRTRLVTASAISRRARSVSLVIHIAFGTSGDALPSCRPAGRVAPFHQAHLQQHHHEQEGATYHRLPEGADVDDALAV